MDYILLKFYSINFSEIEQCLANGNWDESSVILTNTKKALERAGADFIILCTYTMHRVVPTMQKKIGLPIVHIKEAIAIALIIQKIKRVA